MDSRNCKAANEKRSYKQATTKLNSKLKLLVLSAMTVTILFTVFLMINKTEISKATHITATKEKARQIYGQLPLSFEANYGQADESFNFLARGSGYTLALSPTEAVFSLARQSNDQSQNNKQSTVLRMNLVGSNQNAAVEGLDELEGKVNYFAEKDSANWRTNIPTFERVQYNQIYPGIDIVYYGNQKHLEYDFVVAPGKDARTIAVEFAGADKVEVEAETGDLLVRVGAETIRQHAPVTYQETSDGRRGIESRYALNENGQVGFEVEEYDRSAPLIIDPVLVYSTYLGGSSSDLARAIAVDSSGNAYITGYTTSSNFPTANAIQSTFNGTPDSFGSRDVLVTKINAAGTAFVYSTYLGGGGGEEARGVAVDSDGNAYVAGFTNSTNFPIANAIQATKGSNGEDAFVTKINAAGSALVYSTYLGGGGSAEFGEAIAVDSSGNAYVTGATFSNNFPTVNPIQSTYGGGSDDAFLTKINAAGTAFVYSTYLGGSDNDIGKGITTDSSGNVYVIGTTASTNFPTANAIQGSFSGSEDAFITKINAAGTALVYSTYLGGSDLDGGEGIALDSSNNAYVSGFTLSTNFPVANAIQPANGGTSATTTQDAFVTKLNTSGSAFIYSTYLGGAGGEIAFGIKVDAAGSAYVAGSTGSTSSFPTVNALQCTRNGGQDIFITKINAAGSAYVYSTYLGGSGSDDGQGIGIDPSNNAYITGSTTSTDFPTVNPIQAANAGGSPFGDAFVTKLNDANSPNACPTAATVAISGRVMTSSSKGIFRGRVSLTDSSGNTRTTLTDRMGFYRFDEVEAGQTYVLSVKSRRYKFANNPTTLFASENLDGINFAALP